MYDELFVTFNDALEAAGPALLAPVPGPPLCPRRSLSVAQPLLRAHSPARARRSSSAGSLFVSGQGVRSDIRAVSKEQSAKSGKLSPFTQERLPIMPAAHATPLSPHYACHY